MICSDVVMTVSRMIWKCVLKKYQRLEITVRNVNVLHNVSFQIMNNHGNCMAMKYRVLFQIRMMASRVLI